MKAVIYNGINNYRVMEDLQEPIMNELMNVKVKVEYCGICGSDIHKVLFEKTK